MVTPANVGGAVASPHWAATEAGQAALAAGGTAVDAALAAAVTLGVVYPQSGTIGGDLFAVVRLADGNVRSINGSGTAGSGLLQDGRASTATVPGFIDGLHELHRLGAERAWADHFDAAIGWAREGVPTARALARAAEREMDKIRSDGGLSEVFLDHGGQIAPAIVQTELARTLEAIASAGPGAFYRGPIAERLAAGVKDAGGDITMTDLAVHTSTTSQPLTTSFRGLTVHTSPPNSSGVLLLQALRALTAAGLADPPPEDMPIVALILREASLQRTRALSDAATADEIQRWLGDERIADVVEFARKAPNGGSVSARKPSGDTVAVVAADQFGNAVSLIHSVYDLFGCGYLDPATGILLNNRGHSFSTDPAHPNFRVAGKRPAHTLIPMLATRDGAVEYALGTMGGAAHGQILIQVLLRLLAGEGPQEAVSGARWIIGANAPGEPDDLVHFEEGTRPEVEAAFVSSGLLTEKHAPLTQDFGHAQAVRVTGDSIVAGTDPRADGLGDQA